MRPWKKKPLLRSTDSYIPAVNTARFLEQQKRILIVGDAGGRDWEYLRSLGKEVWVVDIAPQENIANMIVQSIEEKTPFADGFFDGVVMNEVLEHLFLDVDALQEVHRLLAADGALVITVPYISNVQDEPEYHVRVHTPKTMRRLLEKCGFQIEEHFCRGFCTRLPQFGMLPRALLYLTHKLFEITGKQPDDAVHIVNSRLEKLERFLGRHKLSIRFQKLFSSYGGIMKVRRVSSQKDFREVQLKYFSNLK